jgi:hypothetical protein
MVTAAATQENTFGAFFALEVLERRWRALDDPRPRPSMKDFGKSVLFPL